MKKTPHEIKASEEVLVGESVAKTDEIGQNSGISCKRTKDGDGWKQIGFHENMVFSKKMNYAGTKVAKETTERERERERKWK